MGITLTQGILPAGLWVAIASGTGAIDITSIPTGFKVLRMNILTSTTAATIKFNNDGGNNYFYKLNGDSTSHAESTSAITLTTGGGATTQLIDLVVYNIASAIKMVVSDASEYAGGATANAGHQASGTWTNNTDEINRITVTGTPIHWVLYGMVL